MDKLNWIIEYNKNNNNEYSNFVVSGKYLAVYKPSHYMARKDGFVYIHQLQAEKKLGRNLNKNECVHHIDKNKFNNDINNLMVFKTKSDHTAFYMGSNIELDGDVYIAINKKTMKINSTRLKICPICKANTCSTSSNMCINCYSQKRKSKIKPNSDILYNLIINYPFTAIGKKFNVSDNTIRKWCKSYGLPYKQDEIKLLKI